MNIILNENEYFTGLVNFILFLRLYATNTSRRQANIIEVLATETLEFGDRKLFPFAELPSIEDYSLTSSLLTDKPIKYSEEFIGSPIKKKISLSRIEPFLKMAMMSTSGLTTFMGYILGLIESAKENFLYNEIMTDLLNWTPSISLPEKEMVKKVTLIDTSFLTSVTDLNAAELQNQKRIELTWQKAFDDFSVFSDVFLDIDNKAKNTNFMSALEVKDLIFIGNAKYLNERVINLMGTLLKSEVLDNGFQRPNLLKIPERTFQEHGSDECIGFVCHRHWYQWFYHFVFMGSFLDIDTARIKNVLHFWYSKGILKNLPVMRLNADYVKSL